ncbi:MAG: DNA repair protein RecO [Gammaproteobacteria bacterium]
MRSKIDLQPAYVLHTHPFQNTSLLVDFFCLEFGRVRAVAKGARRAGSRTRAYLQPFQPLLISLSGKTDLKNLVSVENSVNALRLQGTRLFSGLYVNELIVRLLTFQESNSELYRSYQEIIVALSGERDLQTVLRKFELELLDALGYRVDLENECYSGQPISEQEQYLFHPEVGFERLPIVSPEQRHNPAIFNGADLKALRNGQLEDKSHSKAALRLTRMALQPHLGSKPLASRDLFAKASIHR